MIALDRLRQDEVKVDENEPKLELAQVIVDEGIEC